jgi:hypothetical protein
MIGRSPKAAAELPGEHVLRRIAGLTLGVGLATAALALAMHRPDWAKGLAGGAVLGWLNFRWLRRGIRAMVASAMAQARLAEQDPLRADDSEPPVTSAKSAAAQVASYLALLFRYAMVAIGAYVIFVYLHVPLVSIGLGLCALVAAIIAASAWEIVRPER